jgi:hypothetical protein
MKRQTRITLVNPVLRKTMSAITRYGLAVAFLVGAQLCAPLGAAELSMTGVTADPHNTQCELYGDYTVCWTLSVTGEIQKGDTQHLLSALEVVGRQRPKRGGRSRIGTVTFNSPGGDLTEAMMLGRAIRKHFIQTSVSGGSSCADACLIAFLGGVGRWPLGPVIIHSRYSREFTGIENFDNASAEGTQIGLDLQQYLQEMNITTSLLDEIQKIPNDSAKTLSVPELNRLEIMGTDPGWEKMMKDKRTPE